MSIAFSTSSVGALGVDANSAAGPVTVAAGASTTVGAEATGVLGTAQRNVAVNTGAISTAGINALGVSATSTGGTVNVATGAVATAGGGSTGILQTGPQGVTVNAGAVTTAGTATPAIVATSGAGPVTVTAASVRATGAGSRGTGGTGLAFRNRAIGDYGQGRIGVSIGGPGGERPHEVGTWQDHDPEPGSPARLRRGPGARAGEGSGLAADGLAVARHDAR